MGPVRSDGAAAIALSLLGCDGVGDRPSVKSFCCVCVCACVRWREMNVGECSLLLSVMRVRVTLEDQRVS